MAEVTQSMTPPQFSRAAKIVYGSITVLLLVLFVFSGKIISSKKNYLLSLFSPACKTPIEYSIGTFDKRFGITQAEFVADIGEAAKIWGQPVGLELFRYSDSGKLKVNLIYDERQRETATLKKLNIKIDNNRKSYESLKQTYDKMKAEHAGKLLHYENALSSFRQKRDAYEKEVNYWNAKGGAPEAEYKKLTADEKDLETLAGNLENERLSVNESADNLNVIAQLLNRLANELNLDVEKYNGAPIVGQEFDQGIYQSSPKGAEIDIYQFNSRDKLIRVLAHELGHALDMQHVDDPKAIMYRLNTGTESELTKAELDALKAKCEIK